MALYEDGSCRLCHRQRSLFAHALGRRVGDVGLAEANRNGQQLFIAGLWHQDGTGKREYVKKTVPPNMRLLTPVGHRQLVLFDTARDLQAGLRNGFPPPPHPGREAALLAFVAEHAQRYGWRRSKIERVRRAMRILPGIQDTPGAPIRRSDVALLSRIKHSAAVVADVLADAGLLDEDRQPAIVTWFSVNTADLPEQIRDELGVWLQVMRHGSTEPPRRKPRNDATITTQLRWALPASRQFAAAHPSLREIGVDEVRAVLPGAPLARYTMLQGLRSIFRILKARKLVFVNPTARLSAPQPQSPASVNLEVVRADLNSSQPATAALAALLAFHAVRVIQLCHLQLTDLHDGRLHLGEQVIPLAPPVRTRLAAWLDYRQATWPHTANPHLFIHVRNAINVRPVSHWWIRHQLSIAGQHIRLARILDEAHATSGDIRRLMDMFGLSVEGASRYATTVSSSTTPR
ncbi:hypothetical protein [Actinoplanes sp. L3-i22]|uniref:hypothetical protein n=1 Tax=Actinoplanes sp. L3-i22 TaxID=2836373 RepID=UPI001C75F36E|nr:hypothetical protein [Actinoplanes sp. L3-i22]BCY07324.1 hypothetical protein L3i22_024120 [Actinoplanes sp. L3-i22]